MMLPKVALNTGYSCTWPWIRRISGLFGFETLDLRHLQTPSQRTIDPASKITKALNEYLQCKQGG